jgi:hypothetical protein
MDWTRRLAMATAVVALAVGVGACGDDDSAGDGGAPTTEAVAPTTTGDGGAPTTEAVAPTTTVPELTSGGACESAQRIADIDDEVDVIVRDHLTPVLSSGDPTGRESAFQTFLAEYQELLVNRLNEIAVAYDHLATEVPEALTDAVETLRSGSEQLSAVILEAHSADELSSGFGALGDVPAKNAEATLRVDEYTRAECDIVLAD